MWYTMVYGLWRCEKHIRWLAELIKDFHRETATVQLIDETQLSQLEKNIAKVKLLEGMEYDGINTHLKEYIPEICIYIYIKGTTKIING